MMKLKTHRIIFSERNTPFFLYASATLRYVTVGATLIASTSAWSIARHPWDELVPAGLRNATVRVKDDSARFGSGTVISIFPHRVSPGGLLRVLTADHVVAGQGGWWIGFGDGGRGGPWDYRAISRIRAPIDPETDKRPDLAILEVFVPNLFLLPPLLLPIPSAPTHAAVIQKGFGHTGVVDQQLRRYNVEKEYGTYRNGRNAIDKETVFELGEWRYDALEGDLDFLPGGEWPPTVGESHFLSGDSGGPSVQYHNGQWRLVGVHSASHGGGEHVREGARWWDVRVGSYLSWINQPWLQTVPEPGSIATLSAGLLLFALRRRRRK